MKKYTACLLKSSIVIVISANLLSTSNAQSKKLGKSEWVSTNPQGKLAYKTLEKGDKIMDFSYAGYMGGGIAIPAVPVRVTLSPVAGDNTDAIQNAINEVAKMKSVNGLKGAVLLNSGTYNCDRPININESGVVLRGSGSGENGTIINMTGKPHVCISVRGAMSSKTVGTATNISDAYVPSAAYSFNVSDASAFKVGDTIRITKPVTEAWVKFMGMDQMVRDGKKETWVSGDITTERVIQKIEKNKITVDVPLTDNYDAKYLNPPGVTVVKISTTGELSQIGIESLRIVSAPQSVTITEGSNKAFTMSGVCNAWAKNIRVFNTVNSVSVTGRKITVDSLTIIHNLPTIGAAKPADINGSGQQLLFNHCDITGDNLFFFGTGAKVTGPVVVMNSTFKGNGWIQPHQRWATGLLIDNCNVPDGGIDFMNRGEMGSGHGWAIGFAVAWNCNAKSYLNQLPPGAANWVIGSTGEQQKKPMPFHQDPLLPEGIYDSHGTPVTPRSLYLQQLEERVGKQALTNIGYTQ
jgi:hypothetical protein